ncbi:MAG: NAD-dependent epimerase/dehydratase family protein [Planctomycetia bacterium]
MAKILVTGGAGFIGSHVVDALLAAGHGVAVLDDLSSGSRENLPAGVSLSVCDIVDTAAVEAVFATERPDAVCHQAAQMSVSRSVREPRFDAEVNCIGLINVLDAAVRHGAGRFVFASSGGVFYGNVTTPAPESTPPDPSSPYGITKWAGERYLRFYAEQHGLAAVALRYANVYGPRQNPHGEAGVVAIFSSRLLAGEPACINGDGGYVRDYVFGPDVARANLVALTGALSAVRHDALAPGGEYRRVMRSIDRLTLLNNTRDEALKFFRFIDPGLRTEALGHEQMPARWVCPEIEFTQVDAAPVVGKSLRFLDDLQAPSLARRLAAGSLEGLAAE